MLSYNGTVTDKRKTTDWLLVAFCAIVFILGFELGGFQLALLRSANELGFSGAVMGLPITVNFIAISVFPLIFGPVSDKIGKKIVILASMAVFTIGGIIVWMSDSTSLFFIGIFVLGSGYGVCECSITAAISDIYGKKGENNINLSQSFFCLGAIISPLILNALMDQAYASWRIHFLICAVVMALMTPMLLRMREIPLHKHEAPMSKVKLQKPLLIFGFVVCMSLYIGAEAGISYYADTVFSLELNAASLGAYAISLFWAAMGAGRLYFGRIKTIPPYATAVSLFALSVVLVFMIFSRQEIVVLGLFAAAGLTCSCIWPGIINSAVSLNRSASGRIVSYLNMGTGVGGMLIPFINGVIMINSGMSFSFLFLTVQCAATGMFMWKNRVKT